MTLIGRDVLDAAGRKNKPLRVWLVDWAASVEAAEWASLKDVRCTYPSADGVTLESRIVVTVFNVKGNDYRLISFIDYAGGVVEALEILTHAEYDKNFWKSRY